MLFDETLPLKLFISNLDCFSSYSLKNGTYNFTLKDQIIDFYLLQQNLQLCIFNYTEVLKLYKL